MKDTIVISFFFNARGEHLEKSTSGMYRSLLLQLLEGFPDMQAVLDDPDIIPLTLNDWSSLEVLKDVFRNAISQLGQRSFTCFVDALDECDEQQVMDMVEYFEELAERSTKSGVRFSVCFSSRHYPYIDIRQAIRLTLEDQEGHKGDLADYVGSRLRIKNPMLLGELQEQILRKASGVFLWVVLVVDILNREDRRGRLALRKRLAEIPSGLSELFKDMLQRDSEEDVEALQLCILWILYAKHPLAPEEYYHALWSGLSLKELADSEIPDVAGPDAHDAIERYVISSSKGIAEITKSQHPTVQFIHESVRDFLIKDKGLYEMWPELGLEGEGSSHEKLKHCCETYLNQHSVREAVSGLTSYGGPLQDQPRLARYPFLEYACQQVLYHADMAADTFPQDAFLAEFPLQVWIRASNVFEKYRSQTHSQDTDILHLLAEGGFSKLIHIRLSKDPRTEIVGGRYGYPLFAALINDRKDAVAALLGLTSTVRDGFDIPEHEYMRGYWTYSNRTPLYWAAEHGLTGVVRLLLQQGASVNEEDGEGLTALSRASSWGREAVPTLLIENGADVNKRSGKYGSTPLFEALDHGHKELARFLIEKGADVNVSGNSGRTLLSLALSGGHEALAKLIIERGADVNKRGAKSGCTPLFEALSNGHGALARLLLEKGADVNAGGNPDPPLLSIASGNGYGVVAKLLVGKGADVNASDGSGQTPLSLALDKGHEAVAIFLITRGADVSAAVRGETPLYKAVMSGYDVVARLLIENGADVEAGDGYKTPLSAASIKGDEAVVRALIDNGVDVNAPSPFSGKTPLFLAASFGHEGVARLLISNGADLNSHGTNGKTALSEALAKGHQAIAHLLIENGARATTKGP